MKSGKLLLGLVAGAAAGAVLGILFAPDKGSETRRKIAQKGNDYAEGLKEKFTQFIDTIQEQGEIFMDEANETYEEGKAKVKETAGRALENGEVKRQS